MASIRMLAGPAAVLAMSLALGGCQWIEQWIDPHYEQVQAAATQRDDPVLPKDLGPQAFPLGEGDVIALRVYQQEDMDQTVQIDASGMIFVPFAGEINVIGMTPMELRRLLTEKLGEQFVDPQVIVNVEQANSRRVYVLGQVGKPTVLQMSTTMRALEAIARSGDFNNDARDSHVLLLRGKAEKPEVYFLDLQTAMRTGDMRYNVRLVPGDVLYVPRSVPSRIDQLAAHVSTFLRAVRDAETSVVLFPSVVDAFEGDLGRTAKTGATGDDRGGITGSIPLAP